MTDATSAGAMPLHRTYVAPASRRDRVTAWALSPTGQEVLMLSLISVLAAVLYFLPFMLRLQNFNGVNFSGGMDKVYGMWDGPILITAAVTLWDLNPHDPAYAWLGQPASFYAERFPLYPVLVHVLSPVFGYWNGAIVINVVASTAFTVLMYYFIRNIGSMSRRSYLTATSPAFWVALASIFWPPRAFMYRYVAGADPLFFLGFLGAVYFFLQRRYTWATVFGLMAAASRPNSFIVVGGIGVLALARLAATPAPERPSELRRMLQMLLIPVGFGLILLWDQIHFGDWLAWYHAGNFVHPEAQLYPAMQFYGPGDEGVPYLFLLVLAGIFELLRQRRFDLAWLSLLFYIPSLLVGTDVSRYLLPAFPFAVYLAGERILASAPVRLALLLSIPLVYFYGWETMLNVYYQAPFTALRQLVH